MYLDERNEAGATALFDAVCSGSKVEVERLLSLGADPNIAENNGITPLMEAAADGSVPMIELLLRHGARWDFCDNFGDSAVDYARAEKRAAAVHFLEALGLAGRPPGNCD
jgi:uncharacterized protein